VFLPGDRVPETPTDWTPSQDGLPSHAAMLGTAVDSALLFLEARRWWLEEYHHLDHPMRDAEVEALEAAIERLEHALTCQRRCQATP
jgi:hypothetical protein